MRQRLAFLGLHAARERAFAGADCTRGGAMTIQPTTLPPAPVAKKPSARTRLMDLAEQAIIRKGFAATSIEELVVGAGITKSGFFYHFKDKSELARALLERHLDQAEEMLDDVFARGRQLHDDPLHSFLIAMKLLAEVFDDLPANFPGCIVGSICYQDQSFNRQIRELNAEGLRLWCDRFRKHLEEIASVHPPRVAIDMEALAAMSAAIVEGGIVVYKVLDDHKMMAKQVLLYRSFVQSVFDHP